MERGWGLRSRKISDIAWKELETNRMWNVRPYRQINSWKISKQFGSRNKQGKVHRTGGSHYFVTISNIWTKMEWNIQNAWKKAGEPSEKSFLLIHKESLLVIREVRWWWWRLIRWIWWSIVIKIRDSTYHVQPSRNHIKCWGQYKERFLII